MGYRLLAAALLAVAACRGDSDGTVRLPARPAEGRKGIELPPVALNANSPVIYPEALASQGIEGTVLLRLYVDSLGRIVNDSTRVAESSGYPALDSAAQDVILRPFEPEEILLRGYRLLSDRKSVV